LVMVRKSFQTNNGGSAEIGDVNVSSIT